MFGLRLIKSGKIDKKYGRWLNEIKDERENGDYDIFTNFEKEDAEEDSKKAGEFVNAMKLYLQNKHSISM